MNDQTLPPRLVFEAMLARQGGLYTFDDVMERVNRGSFQSWNQNETWVVTQVTPFPRRTVVEVVWVVGDWAQVPELEARLIEWAHGIGATMLWAVGREGFAKRTLPGWRPVSRNFIKEI